MALSGPSDRNLYDELGLTGTEYSTSSSSDDEEVSYEVKYDVPPVPKDQYVALTKALKQSQLELRIAQENLARSEYGKENRLKILRKTHQSALSLKQSLIQELQDVVVEKDDYISKLEDRLTGKVSEIERSTDNGLGRIAGLYSKVSNDYVELQARHQQTLEELAQERKKCKDAEDEESRFPETNSTPSMIQDIKNLQDKLGFLEKEHQEFLLLKDTNQLLCTEKQKLQVRLYDAEAIIAKNKGLLEQLSSKEMARYKDLIQEKTLLASKCKRLKEELIQSKEKEQQLMDEISAQKKFFHTPKLELSKGHQNSSSKMKKIQPTVFRTSRLVRDLRSDMLSTTNAVRGCIADMMDEICQMSNEVCQVMYNVCERNSLMRRKYLSEMKQRKELHNQLVDLRGNIRVFCRIRPVIGEDGSGHDASIVVHGDKEDDGVVYIKSHGNRKKMEVDKVFGPEVTQEKVFNEVQPLITSCIDGFNVCIFAYGQTGSGKTFTMEGSVDNPGVNQLALRELFAKIRCSHSDWRYSVFVSMVEIYNESIHDLLSMDTEKLSIKLKSDGYYIPGLTQVSVSDMKEVNTVFTLGQKNRSTAATKMNISSSRSHALLCISVMGHNAINGTKSFGKLNLVDLAGSERLNKSGSDGARMQEAKYINKSLSSLADVIYNLRIRSKHIPYRNSKLTFLLQDSLGGNSKTLMIVQLSPVQKNASESFCSLNFAERVRAVELGIASKQISMDKNE